MKRSSPAVDPPPPCALNSPPDLLGKDERSYFPNRTGRTPQQQPRQQKREPQCMNQSWSNTAYDNSNASWESEWSAPSGTPPIKTDSAFYKNRNPGPHQSEWSPSDSSASNSVASSYGMMHTPQQSPSNSLSASSFYENNGFYNSGYGGYGQNAYVQPPYGQHQQQQQQQYQPVRMADGAYNNRNPSSCPPTPVKQPVPDYHRRHMRYGLDGMPKLQIKREPEEYGEMDGENFTSLFTKSLTSLYSQDTESAFSDESKPYDADIMACSTPTPVPVIEEPTGFQRLHPASGGQYPANMSGDYPDARSNFGFYENRNQNCDPPANVVQDIGSDGNQINSFRYDRPSFDDMHLYASSESKTQAKKRKISMPNVPPEGGFTENRKKTPRLMSYKSDSQWTPNSFGFGEIQIKQEPTDDFNTSELNGSTCNRTPGKDSSCGSMGNGNGGNGKTPSQQSDHPKPPPRKRSPGATCFDRFDKKSTPTNKKVSPLSVYAKVQDNVVLSVKCRRYKKRTKPITNKEESACPGREEMENYKRSSLTPDQAAHQVMSELLERVCLFNERNVICGPDLTHMDTMKVKEQLMQFCHRYSLDYRDFEDVSSVLKPRIIKDKTAKNSERASAIRKRTSTSPVQPEAEPAGRTPKIEKSPKKSSHEDSTPAARRVLRKLPGRVDRSRPRRRVDSKAPVVTRRYSTRSARDVEELRGSDVDIVIDSSTDRESEAGKEAEVRKKSQRLKNKQPVAEMPASSEKARKNPKIKKEEPRTRSKEKKTEKPTDESSTRSVPKKKWTRLHMNCSDNLRSSSVEIVDITKSDSPSSSDSNDPFKKEPLSPSTIAEKVKCRSKRSVVDAKRNTSKRIIEKRLSALSASKRNSIETKNNKTSAVSEDSNRSSSKSRDDSSRGRKGIPKKLQITSGNSGPSKPLKKIVTKREPEDSLSESDDSSKQPQSKKSRDSNSRTNSDIKTKLLKAEPKSSESEKSQTDRNKAPKLLKERSKRSLSNLPSAESSPCPKVSNENIKKQTRDGSLSETDSSNASKQAKESNKRSVIVKTEPDSKKSVASKDDSRNQGKDSSDNSKRQISILDSISGCLLKIKKEPQTEEVIPATAKQEDSSTKHASPTAITNPQNVQQETKPAKVVRNLPIKKIPRRRSSQHSESELQVVLTKLPDSQVSLSNGSVPVEVVRMCESMEQQSRTAHMTCTERKVPQCNPDLGKPPELMRMKESSATENQQNDTNNKDNSEDKNVSSPASCAPVNSAKETPPVDKITDKPQTNDRYSESEDSDCGLVIDLDRRQSVEERVPSPAFQNSEKSDDTFKSNQPEGPSAESLLKEPSLSAKAALEASKKATEDACLLLHLSRSAVPPIPSSIKEIPSIITSLPVIDTKMIETPLPEVKEQNGKEAKESDRDESILRTLLLETGDVASGSSHEIVSQSQAGPSSISGDSKAKLNQDVMKLLMYQNYQEVAARNPPSEFDEKKIPLEQLTTDINANILSEAEDWGNDPVTMKEKVKKLKNEIACLQFLADQKDKERIAILCFKRYKEEVLKRLKIMDHIRDWVNERYKSPSEERSPSDPNQPVATTSTAHNSIATEADVHPRLSPTRQVIQLAYHATVKTDVPTASVTSGESLTSQCGEKLPAVATMIANATENYGVDMRTVSRNSSTTKTIVQEVVSSRESIYSPAACGSPLSQEQRIGESVQIFQKTMSTTRESTFSPSHSRSPSLPELSPGGKSTHHFTKRVFSCSSSSSQSPPSLQPELRPNVGSSFTSTSSSFQPHYPLSLVVTASDTKTESSKTLHVSSSGKPLTEAPKNSPRSSPKRSSSSSYSVWSSVHTGRSSSAAIDLHTDRIGVQETSTKRTTTASHSLMVAPPPTTILQSTLKHPIQQRPRLEPSHERPLKNPVEKIFHHKSEEEPRPMSFSSVATSSNSMAYGGHSNGSSTAKSSSTLNGPPRCMGCGISDAKFLCSGCRKHWYCSAKCQTMRWPDHSRVCLGRQYNSSPSSSYS